ncbi:MAG: DUF3667 domain-containing protein [Chitinophagaceae bacterium]|nr:MAG: DUF3667 domain-containing protein [Chitinophagaceae bacterium]
MSHLKERIEKNCLNCNALIYGKYCHVCGQENLEPVESFWHLVTHFFNDITHFDGKFFSTLKLLVTKPGFLSGEYKRGRRNSYLNPVRMYIFTSFVFFIIFYNVFKPGSDEMKSLALSGYSAKEVAALDSAEFANFTKVLTRGRVLDRAAYANYVDSLLNDSSYSVIRHDYKSAKEYDSLLKKGKVKESWWERKIIEKEFEIRRKYDNQQQAYKSLTSGFIHLFPQILFLSLPFFALLLRLIYIRRKQFHFVAHGIYAIHLYIFYFIILALFLSIRALAIKTGIGWIQGINIGLIIYLLLYEYKAMRNFYGQRRAKTILKFIIALSGRIFIILIIFFIFLVFSVYTL